MRYHKSKRRLTSLNLIQGWQQSKIISGLWEPAFLPGICDQISDDNWRSLPSRPDFSLFKDIFLDCNCSAVISRILAIPNNYLKEVALKMGAINPTVFHVQSIHQYGDAVINRDEKISLSPALISALIDQEDSAALVMTIDPEADSPSVKKITEFSPSFSP